MYVSTSFPKLAASVLAKVPTVSGVPLATAGNGAVFSSLTNFVVMFLVALSSKLTKTHLVVLAYFHPFKPGLHQISHLHCQ